MNCVTEAWLIHEEELRSFLLARLHDRYQTEDLLQDIFIKAIKEGRKFCELENARAWLFRVTKNQLIDYQRTLKQHDDIPEQLGQTVIEKQPVANLSTCLPYALTSLNDEDKAIIQSCDLEGMSQKDYADANGLSLTGAKSRIQRARKRLKQALQVECNIIFDKEGNVCCFGSDIKTPE